MTKYLYKFMIATLILISTTVVRATNEVYYTNKHNIEMTEQEYNNLLGLGFTEKQISRMDYELFMDNKDIEATVVSEDTKYVKMTTTWRNGIKYYTSAVLTEEEIMEELRHEQPTGPSRASGNYYNAVSYSNYIVLTSRIANIDDTYMRYKVDMYWLQMPSVRSFDIIGIGIEPSKVEIGTNPVFRQNYTDSGGNELYSTTYYPKEGSTGGAAMFELPSGSLTDLDALYYFQVKKINPNATIDGLVATGDYAHANTSVTDNVYYHYSINYGSGIFIDGTYYNYYDTVPEAFATFLGSW